MTTALDEVADTADEVADDTRRVARKVRSMGRQRERGRAWSDIVDGDDLGVLGVLRRSTRRLTNATGTLARSIASGLAAEGESRRQIARRLSVTHQRVTALIRGNGSADSNA